jgi:lipid A 4'-phosphatase
MEYVPSLCFEAFAERDRPSWRRYESRDDGTAAAMTAAHAITNSERFPKSAGAVAAVLCVGALIVGTVAGFAVHAFPALDIATSRFFYLGGRYNFYGSNNVVVDAIRLGLFIVFVSICVSACAGIAISLLTKRPWLGVPLRKWIQLAVCLIVGPGVIANFGLKDTWGRARPTQIVEFAGTKAYTPPLTPADQCKRNCSFVSGEASNLFMGFFGLALLFPLRARLLIALGLIAGSFTGFIRMTEGAHFLSDIVFAGVIMALTAAGIQALFALADSNLKSRPSEVADKSWT